MVVGQLSGCPVHVKCPKKVCHIPFPYTEKLTLYLLLGLKRLRRTKQVFHTKFVFWDQE